MQVPPWNPKPFIKSCPRSYFQPPVPRCSEELCTQHSWMSLKPCSQEHLCFALIALMFTATQVFRLLTAIPMGTKSTWALQGLSVALAREIELSAHLCLLWGRLGVSNCYFFKSKQSHLSYPTGGESISHSTTTPRKRFWHIIKIVLIAATCQQYWPVTVQHIQPPPSAVTQQHQNSAFLKMILCISLCGAIG